MVMANLYSSNNGPFDYRYKYFGEVNILQVAFHDPTTAVQTDNFLIKCEDLYGAYLWMNEFVVRGLDPEATSGEGKVASPLIPALVADLHERANSNPSVWTGWFSGAYSPVSYRVLDWDDFVITGDPDGLEDEGAHVGLSIPKHIQLQLGYYVYALRDPRNGEIFYVGKGKDERIIQHVLEAVSDEDKIVESAKIARIKDIEALDLEVEHLFIRYGIGDEDTAFAVEQAVIDAFYAAGYNLTNQVKGHHSSELGLASLQTVLSKFQADPLPAINASVIMLKINRLWKSDMSPAQIKDATHGYWKIGADTRSAAKYALGIAFGIVRGVYRIGEWHESTIDGHENRWWFEAEEAPEFRDLIGKHVKDAFVPGSSNPYQKFLDGYTPAM
jgi:hypothetical protein